MPHEVTIILPCAGSGTRLGLPFPKELAPLKSGQLVIDSCLRYIGNLPVDYCKVIVMDDGKRDATIGHIKARLPAVPVARVEQDPRAVNLPDAVLYLQPWLGKVNILMLPDVVYTADPAVIADLAKLTEEAGFAFAAASMPDDKSRLRQLGALEIAKDRDIVVSYKDKPADPAQFSAAWGMIGFSGGSEGIAGMKYITLSTSANQLPDTGAISIAPVAGAPVVWMKDFRDCGTWFSYLNEVRRG